MLGLQLDTCERTLPALIILDPRNTLGLNNPAAARRNVLFCADTRMEP
jgi:hypothetical protein